MDRTRTGVIILCFGCLSLHLLASLLFQHSPPKFPNLVNCGIALAKESTPLFLSSFSRLEDQTLSISWRYNDETTITSAFLLAMKASCEGVKTAGR
jgi:hypothetical protein